MTSEQDERTNTNVSLCEHGVVSSSFFLPFYFSSLFFFFCLLFLFMIIFSIDDRIRKNNRLRRWWHSSLLFKMLNNRTHAHTQKKKVSSIPDSKNLRQDSDTDKKQRTTRINLLSLASLRDLCGFHFFRHVTRVAKYVKSKRPQIKLFIWHDMLSQLVNGGNNNVSEHRTRML